MNTRGVDMRKIIILLLCLVLVSCGTTNKSKSTTKDTSVNSFFGFKKKVKEKLIYKKDTLSLRKMLLLNHQI